MAEWVPPKIVKMMKNMQWEQGKGLGIHNQGILEPIQLGSKIQFNSGLGSCNEKSFIKDEKRVLNVKKKVVKLKMVNYKIENLKSSNLIESIGNCKFVDMTQPTKTSYNTFNEYQQQQKNFLPSLTFNLNQLIDECLNEFHTNAEKLNELKDENEKMERKIEELEICVGKRVMELKRSEEVFDLVKSFNNVKANLLQALNGCHQIYKRLKFDYLLEFRKFGLNSLIEIRVLPMMKQLFASWDPYDLTKFIDENQWKNEFKAIIEWTDCLSLDLIAQILIEEFFEKWNITLCQLLKAKQPNSFDVSKYYRACKSMVPIELLKMDGIKAQFISALIAIKKQQKIDVQ